MLVDLVAGWRDKRDSYESEVGRMKFLVSWTPVEGGSAEENLKSGRRLLEVFGKWSPPADQTFHAFLSRLDGQGGYALIETESPRGLLESSAKFAPWLRFEIVPVADINDSVPVFNEALDWIDSIP